MKGRKQYNSQLDGATVSRQATHFTQRVSQMVYSTHMGEPVVIARGKYMGYPFLILNLGTHPTAYVCVAKKHRFFGKTTNFLERYESVCVHGGFTYSEPTVKKSSIKDRWWIGWDYAHINMGDYLPFINKRFYPENVEPKQWMREEVIAEIKQAIKQIDEVK